MRQSRSRGWRLFPEIRSSGPGNDSPPRGNFRGAASGRRRPALDKPARRIYLTNWLVKTRRRTRDAQAAVFGAAAEEFALRGYDAARVDRIAARAKVNKATIYYYFASKRGLYLDVLRQVFRAVGVRARTIADGPGAAGQKTDAWIAAIVEEASARPWFPPIMLRELASGAPHFDPDTFATMDTVYVAVRDIIQQGQREGAFRQVDPLLTHLTIMPAVLIFFVRQRVLARNTRVHGVAEPRAIEDFQRYMQDSVRRILEHH
jgi:AcrR family transcriptional regulator